VHSAYRLPPAEAQGLTTRTTRRRAL